MNKIHLRAPYQEVARATDDLLAKQEHHRRSLRQAMSDKYPVRDQLDKVVEELLELALALTHYKDGKCSLDDVLEEIADVEIASDILVRNAGWVEELEPMRIKKYRKLASYL